MALNKRWKYLHIPSQSENPSSNKHEKLISSHWKFYFQYSVKEKANIQLLLISAASSAWWARAENSVRLWRNMLRGSGEEENGELFFLTGQNATMSHWGLGYAGCRSRWLWGIEYIFKLLVKIGWKILNNCKIIRTRRNKYCLSTQLENLETSF